MKNYQKNSSLNWWDLKSLLIMVIQKGNVHFKIIRRCSRRSTTDGFAEQNGRDAEQSGLILLITLRFFYNDKGHREVD